MKRYSSAKDIRVGAIGYGSAFSIGKQHLIDMQQAGMTPIAIVELGEAQRQKAREDWPATKVYADVGEMLRRSDANLIAIITPHNTHAKLALQCLRAGRQVVLEKPFAIHLSECDRIIAEARKRGLMLTTYHNRHWDGCVMRAVKTVRSGAIGDLVRARAYFRYPGNPDANWRFSKSISGGILYDWGVHFVEYALQIVAADIVEISGFAKYGVLAAKSPWKSDANEDEATAIVRFANGVIFEITITALDPVPQTNYSKIFELQGTKGVYRFGIADWELIQRDSDNCLATESGPNPAGRWDLYYRNIADHLVKGTPLVITPEWARRPIQILDLAGQSARMGKTLKAKYK